MPLSDEEKRARNREYYRKYRAEKSEILKAVRKRYYEKWYPDNKEKMSEASKRHMAKMKVWLREQKDKPCMDCGIKYPYYVMDFDHRPGEGKNFNPGRLIHTSIKVAEVELAKCDLVCANCHRERTHSRGYAPDNPE